LVLTAATNRIAGRWLTDHAPSFAWMATTALCSCLTIVMLYALIGTGEALRWRPLPAGQRRRVIGLAAGWWLAWMAGCIAWADATGQWIIYAHGWQAVTAFLLFGPLGEELLFRGILFGHARRIWPNTLAPAVLISTIAFSLHHIALATAPAGLVIAQLLFTIPLGVVLALLRARAGSIWIGLGLHVATNLPAAF
jgi:membrane protease YdiL (CAAX protease family)